MTDKKIFIGGSVQLSNWYNYGTYDERKAKYNEGIQIQQVVDYMVGELKKYHVEVHRTTLVPYMDLNASAKKANDLGCTSYYAIHSNAGGGKGVTALKQTSLYVPKARRDKSAIMASELCSAIEGLGRINRGTYGKRDRLGREWYSDLRQPKMASTILEIEFHDWDMGAKWIIDNKALIGRTLARRIAKIEGLVLKVVTYTGAFPTAPISTEVGTISNITRWQKFLCWYGLKVEIDGSFGADTKRKTVMFQQKNGLYPDGWAGYKTLDKAKTVGKL